MKFLENAYAYNVAREENKNQTKGFFIPKRFAKYELAGFVKNRINLLADKRIPTWKIVKDHISGLDGIKTYKTASPSNAAETEMLVIKMCDLLVNIFMNEYEHYQRKFHHQPYKLHHCSNYYLH